METEKLAKPQFRISNGFTEDLPNRPFWLFISHGGDDEVRLSKNMAIATGRKSPFPETEVCGYRGHDLARCLIKSSGTVEK